ncbi:hypothetical protein [Streptomyces sp. NBC_00076]|uniref:hypothetical protein n=1 Tax=Streptomyces sp. NBC_00076 TaxID=2975642 RepID=UPI003245B4BA
MISSLTSRTAPALAAVLLLEGVQLTAAFDSGLQLLDDLDPLLTQGLKAREEQ